VKLEKISKKYLKNLEKLFKNLIPKLEKNGSYFLKKTHYIFSLNFYPKSTQGQSKVNPKSTQKNLEKNL
jgi:hypothetical protein